MKGKEFVKEIYLSDTVGPNRRGRPLGKWKDRVKEYMNGRGTARGTGGRVGLNKLGSVWTGSGGSSSAMVTPLGADRWIDSLRYVV